MTKSELIIELEDLDDDVDIRVLTPNEEKECHIYRLVFRPSDDGKEYKPILFCH